MTGIFVLWGSAGTPIHAWLKSCDVDAHNGRGFAEFTTDPANAMTFANGIAAFDYYRRVSTVRPIREDGEPNRPLTAFTIEIIPLP